ncbi:hypothetical protein Tco_1354814 [Tanacetum coccineum]
MKLIVGCDEFRHENAGAMNVVAAKKYGTLLSQYIGMRYEDRVHVCFFDGPADLLITKETEALPDCTSASVLTTCIDLHLRICSAMAVSGLRCEVNSGTTPIMAAILGLVKGILRGPHPVLFALHRRSTGSLYEDQISFKSHVHI